MGSHTFFFDCRPKANLLLLVKFLLYGEIRDSAHIECLVPDDDEGDISLMCSSLISFSDCRVRP